MTSPAHLLRSARARAATLLGSASLTVAEQRFRRVFEDSPAPMALAALDMTVLDVNAALAKFLGREIADIVGENVADFSEPEDMLEQRRMHEALLAGEMGHYTIEKRYRQADGTHVLGEVTVSLVRDERGRPVSLQSQIRDISEQRRTAEALDRRARYSEAAAELGRIALVAADMGELAERLAEAVAERLGADTCQITEVDGVELHCLAVHGADIGRSQGERWTMRERSLAGLVFGTDGPLVVEDLANSELDASAGLLASGMRSTMGVSVEGRDGPAGMVAVFSREQRTWSHEESSFLHVVANVMGSAIERSTREEAAVHRALHDPLTGLPNRDLFADRLALTLARARRGGPLPAVLIADLDQFKLINDSLGHHAGDELLCAVAPRLAVAVRDTDTVARFGGDEFVVLCDGVGSEEQALELARRLAARARRAAPGRRRAGLHLGRRSGSPTPAPTATPRACCATPTPRCTARRRAAAGAASCSTRRCARRRWRGWRSRPGCGSRSAPTSSRCTSSRWSTSRAARRWRSRR